MGDVPLSLAIISTITPAAVGVVPLAAKWIQDARHYKRAETELVKAEQSRLARERRAECIRLLELARNFRVLAENTHESSGAELDANAGRVRQSAADIAGQADKVEFMVPGTENEAFCLADATGRLAAPVADKKNRASGAALHPPDFTEFDKCLEEFKQAARAALGEVQERPR